MFKEENNKRILYHLIARRKRNESGLFKDGIGKEIVTKAGEQLSQVNSKVGKTLGKAANGISEAGNYAKMLGSKTSYWENKPKTYGENNPLQKIHNVEAFPKVLYKGINRVVKLLIVINGEVIQSFKHFKLLQSASRHHTLVYASP